MRVRIIRAEQQREDDGREDDAEDRHLCGHRKRREKVDRDCLTMLGGEAHEGDPLKIGNASHAPVVKRLRGQPETGNDGAGTYRVDQVSMCMGNHEEIYKRYVDSVKGELLIAAADPLPAWLDTMTVAERILARMNQLGLSKAEVARRAGMSAQRFGNYAKKDGRIPDKAAMSMIAAALNTDIASLTGINDAIIDAIQPILRRLFELEGIPQERAKLIAHLAAEALRLQTALEDEGDAQLRARMAAQAAWQSHNAAEPD